MRDVQEEHEQQTSGPFFATICFALLMCLGVLYMYCNDIIKELKYNAKLDSDRISELRIDNEYLKSKVKRVTALMEKYKNENGFSDKDFDIRNQMITYKAEIERYKSEIQTYEEIQSKSNQTLKLLMDKLNECKQGG